VVLSPQKFEHGATADRVGELLRAAFPQGFWVRTQLPLDLGATSEPEPDVSVVTGTVDDYADHPTSAVLVVEVSDTTLGFDREQKAELYSRAGIPEYWIINLVQEQVEVHRYPSTASYTEVRIFHRGDEIKPLGAPTASILVSKILT